MLIAAAAEVEQLVVVSRDVREFVAAGVPVFDPWTATFWAPGQPKRILETSERADLLTVLSEN